MNHFIGSLSTEFIKIRNSFAFWLLLLGAGFMPGLVFFVVMTKWKNFIPKTGENTWTAYTEISWKGMAFLYTNFWVVLLMCLVLNIEHKSIAWKHLFTLPVKRSSLYLYKYLTLLILFASLYGLFIPFWLVSGNLLGILHPELKMLSTKPDYLYLLSTCFHSFVATLGVFAIHFWMSIRFKNMIIPIGFAIVSGIVFVALFQGRAPELVYYPYSYNYLTVNPQQFVSNNQIGVFAIHEIFSLLYFAVFSLLSYVDFVNWFKE